MNAQLDPLASTSVARPLLAPELPAAPGALRAAITAAWLKDETEHVRELLDQARLPVAEQANVQAIAADLVTRVRARSQDQGAIEAFMRQYDLGSEEGVLLMCVAEALLRIPDQDTADKLIRDKLGDADWKKHMGGSDSVLVNASTWGLMLTGQLVQLNDLTRADVPGAFKRLIGRVGEPVIRLAVRQAMKIMGHQFVMGRTIGEALSRSRKGDNANYRYSFDMLGEGALTMKDAQRYLQAYRDAIHAIGRSGSFVGTDVFAAPSISIKLSALYPRYEHAKRARVMAELVPGVLELAQLAKSYGIGYTVDAEEADRLELSLDIIEATFSDPSLDGWEGYGLAVQAYQKRTPYTIDFLADLARRVGRRIPVRLVKGAYWDAEIKRAQIEGHPGYPVFTRKQNTDVSYLACARRMFAHSDALYPMFATHNAQTIAAVRAIAAGKTYEHQKLHGMGDDLYAEVIPADRLDLPCRVYAPVGSHEDLLPYLVRRLLENGANSSFVNRITDEDVAIEDLIRDPVEAVTSFTSIPHPKIPLPADLLRSQNQNRKNSMGGAVVPVAARRLALCGPIASALYRRTQDDRPVAGGHAPGRRHAAAEFFLEPAVQRFRCVGTARHCRLARRSGADVARGARAACHGAGAWRIGTRELSRCGGVALASRPLRACRRCRACDEPAIGAGREHGAAGRIGDARCLARGRRSGRCLAALPARTPGACGDLSPLEPLADTAVPVRT